jgi:hypothetical protein
MQDKNGIEIQIGNILRYDGGDLDGMLVRVLGVGSLHATMHCEVIDGKKFAATGTKWRSEPTQHYVLHGQPPAKTRQKLGEVVIVFKKDMYTFPVRLRLVTIGLCHIQTYQDGPHDKMLYHVMEQDAIKALIENSAIQQFTWFPGV